MRHYNYSGTDAQTGEGHCGEIEGWVYRLAHLPFDDNPQMSMDDRSESIRNNRADWRKKEMGMLPVKSLDERASTEHSCVGGRRQRHHGNHRTLVSPCTCLSSNDRVTSTMGRAIARIR